MSNERALRADRRAMAKTTRGGVDPRFARGYLMYALRHGDVDLAGEPVCR